MTDAKPADGHAIIARARLLGDFLRTDVQDDPHRIGEIAACLAALHDGGGTGGAFYGNLYSLKLARHGAVLANERDAAVPHETIPLADFGAAFAAWTAKR